MTTVELILPDSVAERLISLGKSAAEMIEQALRARAVEGSGMALSRWEITFDRYLELTGKMRAQNMILAKRRFEFVGATVGTSWEAAARVAEQRPGTAVSDEGPLLNLGRVGLAGLIPRLFPEVWVSDGVLLKHIRPGTNFGPPGAFAAYDLIERGLIQVAEQGRTPTRAGPLSLHQEFDTGILSGRQVTTLQICQQLRAPVLLTDEPLLSHPSHPTQGDEVGVLDSPGVIVASYASALIGQAEAVSALRELGDCEETEVPDSRCQSAIQKIRALPSRNARAWKE